jgi:hypothetical protein
MRTVAALAVVVALCACSESTDRDAAGGWKKDALADGRLSFEMPGSAEHRKSTKSQGPDTIHEERASCEYDHRHHAVSVLSGEALVKDMGTTEKERLRWASFFLVGALEQEEERSIEDEGKWTQGKLGGKWILVALPPKPPERTVPVYTWLYAAPWENKAVLVRFTATQASYDDEVRGAVVDQARERFVASVAVE